MAFGLAPGADAHSRSVDIGALINLIQPSLPFTKVAELMCVRVRQTDRCVCARTHTHARTRGEELKDL